jgi:hypothetical protein
MNWKIERTRILIVSWFFFVYRFIACLAKGHNWKHLYGAGDFCGRCWRTRGYLTYRQHINDSRSWY